MTQNFPPRPSGPPSDCIEEMYGGMHRAIKGHALYRDDHVSESFNGLVERVENFTLPEALAKAPATKAAKIRISGLGRKSRAA